MMTAGELAEWEAYDRLDPVGTWRDDYSMASLQALVVNIVSHLYVKKGHQPKTVSPLDFMPDFSGEISEIRKKQELKKMKQQLLIIANTFGGK